MRLESEIIEDKLIKGFDMIEETMIKLDEVEKYINRIRNESKKEYASNYFKYIKGESNEPEVPSILSFMDAQKVRTSIQGMTEGLIFEAPIQAKGWTQASVAKFGKTIGKDPQEHGFFDACVARMEGKKGFDGDKAKRFCASIKDASYGSAFWRGKGKKKKDIKKDVEDKPFPKGKQLKKGKKVTESRKKPIVKNGVKLYWSETLKKYVSVPKEEVANEAKNIRCSRCKKTFRGKDEYDAEMKFNMHKCKGKRDLNKMPMDLLKLVATNKMKEDDAWKEADKRG